MALKANDVIDTIYGMEMGLGFIKDQLININKQVEKEELEAIRLHQVLILVLVDTNYHQI